MKDEVVIENLKEVLKRARDYIRCYCEDRHFAENPEMCSHCFLLKEIKGVLGDD